LFGHESRHAGERRDVVAALVLAIGAPLLYIGPRECHVADMTPADARGRWAFVTRDADGIAGAVLEARARFGQPGDRAGPRPVAGQYAQAAIVGQLADILDSTAATGGSPPAREQGDGSSSD
jgi:hypothetical protein